MLPSISGVTSDGVIEYSHAPNIRQIFPIIRPGIEKIISTNREPYVPEDVYAALVCGGASLYVGYREGAYAGFAVLRQMAFDFDTSPVLNIWLGYSVDRAQGAFGIEVAKAVAAAAGIERVVFSSPQKGWASAHADEITTWYEVR